MTKIPKKPMDKMEESSGELEPMPNKEKLQNLINNLKVYREELDENYEVNFKVGNKSVEMEGNESGLVSVAIRILNIAKYPKGAHFHLDKHSGEFDDNSDELIISKN